MMSSRFIRWGMLIGLLVLIAACGGDDDDAQESSNGDNPPAVEGAITPENADQVVQVGMIGRGRLETIAVSLDGTTLAIMTQEGLWIEDLAAQTNQYFPSIELELPTFSPDGSLIAGLDNDDGLRVLDLSGETVWQVDGVNRTDRIEFSPDGSLLMAHQELANTHWIVIWQVDSGDEVARVENAASVAFSPDGLSIAVGMADGTIGWLDLETGEVAAHWEGHSDVVTAVEFSVDGTTLLSGSDDHNVQLWGVPSGETLRIFETGLIVLDVEFAPDGRSMMSKHVARRQGTQIWDIGTGDRIRVFEREAVYLSDSQHVVSESRTGEFGVWDIQSGELTQAFEGHTGRVSQLFVMPDGESVLSVGDADGSIRLWDVETGAMISAWENFFATNGEFTPDGQHILSWRLNGPNEFLSLWDVETGTVVQTFSKEGEAIGGGSTIGFVTAFSSDERWMATADFDGIVTVWDVETGEVVQELQAEGLLGIEGVAFSPDDRYLAAARRLSGAIWNVESGEVVEQFEPQERDRQMSSAFEDRIGAIQVKFLRGDRVEIWSPQYDESFFMDFDPEEDDFFDLSLTAITIASNGQTAVSYPMGPAEVWDVESGDTLYTFDYDVQVLPFEVMFSYDNRYILLGSTGGDQVVVIEARTGDIVQQIEIDDLTSAAWSPVSHVLAVATDEQVWLYDGESGEELWTLEMSFGYGRQVKFSPTGDYFMTTGFEFIYQFHGIVEVFGLAE